MGIAVEVQESLAAKFTVVFPHLDERQRRLVAGAEARALGHGGIRVVARAAGMREGTVSRGVAELEAGEEPLGRARRPGGGRKRLADVDPGLRPALLALVEPDMRGDPQSPLRWTTKSLRVLAVELTRQGHRVSADTVADLLHEDGVQPAGQCQDPGRQAEPRSRRAVPVHQRAGPGRISRPGTRWSAWTPRRRNWSGITRTAAGNGSPKGEPVQVSVHDFPDKELGKAIPYGIYDVAANTGWVNVGTDHDTAAFAVESIRRWWHAEGTAAYPACAAAADHRGRGRLQQLPHPRVEEPSWPSWPPRPGWRSPCCHFPPGTTKWNTIEHRLFSQITMNWRGRP